ncbi:MAG: bifunctional phosphoribosylaminoimidazolecarboxamide formyltransferase/IMP cyclohydrolase [Gemmatimonadales bacterium]|nr:bifunctional phosphoribosylaminoimidazolecarboxamide formyltransferase/IMP cyclohydrolase [Gemmatimonadales bacterium]
MSYPRRALISVTDKTGLVDVARTLVEAGFQLVASGGTARHLEDAGLPVTGVAELTGYPEVFGGRVKTLHPVIHGGILGPTTESFAATAEQGIAPIEIVIVNLYRFEEAVARGAGEAETVEQIDIGGPTLLRAAAKNFSRVTVLSRCTQYEDFLADFERNGGATSLGFRRQMATAAFELVERYDNAIASWMAGPAQREPAEIALRYGENPHQVASLHLPPVNDGEPALASVGLEQHGGKELSYNNIVDLIAAVKLIGDFDGPCCGVSKHTNPCGFGLGEGSLGLERALKCDPVSAFGGVFAFNREVDQETAGILGKLFLEIIVAPSFSEEAMAHLKRKKNVRILTVDMEHFLAATRNRSRSWGSMILKQDEDEGFPELNDWNVVAGREPDPKTVLALSLVWKVCKHGKSNAIVLGNEESTIGLGFGQMSRVDSVELAIAKAKAANLDIEGCVAGSDGFFPFPDGVTKLAAAGVKAIIAPGGSIRDEEVAKSAAEMGITLILTGRRHFNH